MSCRQVPLITVITVVYNSAALLEATMRSVLGVTYGAIEYIIIDGGSNDGTVDIIKKYENRLKYWVSEPDGGIYDAMNKGWQVADSDSFILFLGAGDRLLSLPVEMDRYTINDVVFGRVFLGDAAVFKPRAGLLLKLYNTLHHQALLVHKSLHLEPPFDIKYRVYADFDFNQRLYKHGVNFIYDDMLSAFALPNGLSGRTNIAELCAITRKNFGFWWFLLSYFGFRAAGIVPILRRFRPISKVN